MRACTAATSSSRVRLQRPPPSENCATPVHHPCCLLAFGGSQLFVTLKYGDRLPTVALVQSLLVAHRFDVQVDGHFGHDTREAVRAFHQRAHVTPVQDVVIPRTWEALSATSPPRALRVVEQIDGSDAIGMLMCMPRVRCAPGDRPVSQTTSDWVNDPPWITVNRSVVQVAQPGGETVFNRLATANRARSVDLLRFHGHGLPGHQVLFWGASFDHMTISTPAMQATLMRLGTIMRPTGSIELHGCNTGMGASGRRLLQAMANATRVPVSAGRPTQYGGLQSNGFEGAVVTCCPNGRSLADWARSAFTGTGG